ncbi:hypothetical protein A4G16_02320 [Mannheimia granulomatis]|uniref:DUF7689 domain-containing protein n=1 Tax=Mannheimia granulomatis TaxID=85402 RepID=A0A6G8JHF9_9PAST|nr:hypothetical protein [Mannheimia granulomatis]QIM66288.1 hypothetical protein A4G16_02320 [Mannheimia granulomatis]
MNECKNIPTYSKPLDKGESILYKSFFPNLNLATTKETSIATQCYNCVAWTLGVTDDWLWPLYHPYLTDKDTTLADFDRFYQEAGFTRVSNINEAHIIAWGNTLPNGKLYMTHACIAYPQSKQWESKLGAYIRIAHDLDGLKGESYGQPVAYYKKSAGEAVQQNRPKLQRQQPTITHSDLIKLSKALSLLSKNVIHDFDTLYENWIQFWQDSADKNSLLSSNPVARKQSTTYKELIQFGQKNNILPLLILRLYVGDYWALLAYDELQSTESLKVFHGTECHVLEGQHGRARRTVKKYIDSLT